MRNENVLAHDEFTKKVDNAMIALSNYSKMLETQLMDKEYDWENSNSRILRKVIFQEDELTRPEFRTRMETWMKSFNREHR